MRKSILDQFAADAINAPETVTGGRHGRGHGGGGTRTRTRGNAANGMIANDRRGRTRIDAHSSQLGAAMHFASLVKKRRARKSSPFFITAIMNWHRCLGFAVSTILRQGCSCHNVTGIN